MTPPTDEARAPRRYRKIGYVLAEQAAEAGAIQTPEGVMCYEAGDYLVTDAPPTHMWPVKRDIFERTYRPIYEELDQTKRELAEYADVIGRAGFPKRLKPDGKEGGM